MIYRTILSIVAAVVIVSFTACNDTPTDRRDDVYDNNNAEMNYPEDTPPYTPSQDTANLNDTAGMYDTKPM